MPSRPITRSHRSPLALPLQSERELLRRRRLRLRSRNPLVTASPDVEPVPIPVTDEPELPVLPTTSIPVSTVTSDPPSLVVSEFLVPTDYTSAPTLAPQPESPRARTWGSVSVAAVTSSIHTLSSAAQFLFAPRHNSDDLLVPTLT